MIPSLDEVCIEVGKAICYVSHPLNSKKFVAVCVLSTGNELNKSCAKSEQRITSRGEKKGLQYREIW